MCALCASSDAEYRAAHEVLRRLPVHEFGHCVWRAICFVLENPLHGLSENQAPRWPMRICAVLIPCLLEPLPIVGLLSELRATRSSTSMRFPPVALAQGRWAEALHRRLAVLHSVSKQQIPSIGIRRDSTTVDGASAVDSMNQLTGSESLTMGCSSGRDARGLAHAHERHCLNMTHELCVSDCASTCHAG